MIRNTAFSALMILLVQVCSPPPESFLISDEDKPLVELYFNQPGIRKEVSIDPDADDRMAELIDNARKSVYLAFYGFRRQVIIDAVIRAVKRGIDVQFAGNATTYLHHEPGYIAYEKLMPYYPNARMMVGNSQSIMHNKWLVVDELYVMTGTGNITDSEFENNDNIWIVIRDREFALDYVREHRQMMTGRFGHAKIRADLKNTFEIGPGLKIENYFSPQEDAMTRLLQATTEARSNINFMIFAFTHDTLGRLFIEKHRQFVRENASDNGNRYLKGVLDRSQFTHAQYIEIYRLAGACGDPELPTPGTAGSRCDHPLDIKRDGNEASTTPGDWQAGGGRLHAKVIIVDEGTPEAKVLMGSFNWSPNANNNNDENLLVIHSPDIARRVKEKFDEIYANGISLPGSNLPYQGVVISEVNYAGTNVAACFSAATPTVNNRIAYSASCPNKYYYALDGNEFIEVYNPNNFTVDVSYWSFYFPHLDGYYDPGVYNSGFPSYEAVQEKAVVGFPEGTKIPPKGFLILFEPDQRNLDINAYNFPASVTFNPETGDTSRKVSVYNPYNALSNFMTLFDRRNSGIYRSGAFPFNYTNFETNCQPFFGPFIDRFTSSGMWDIEQINATAGFPYKLGLHIELRDSRGNTIDFAGPGRLVSSAAQANGELYTIQGANVFEKGGIHLQPALATDPPTDGTIRNPSAAGGSGSYLCGHDSIGSQHNPRNYRLVSMERKHPFTAGNLWSSWDHSTENGQFLLPEARERTFATPGEQNSNWSSLP